MRVDTEGWLERVIARYLEDVGSLKGSSEEHQVTLIKTSRTAGKVFTATVRVSADYFMMSYNGR